MRPNCGRSEPNAPDLKVAVEEDGQTRLAVKLSDSASASHANRALDLGPNDLVVAANVKRVRERERGDKTSEA